MMKMGWNTGLCQGEKMRHDIEEKTEKHDRKHMNGRLDNVGYRVRVKLKVSWTKKSWMEIWTEAIWYWKGGRMQIR
jgi:hypothetical protein